MSLAAVLALGFFLGMRHATDADHVVAVSAIVSRRRTLRAAAPIGMLWGIGHTLTILLVGGAIILFGIVIPPRLGLSMEFSVAIMLVLLGALNVRSVLRDARAIAGAHTHTHTHDLQHVHGGIAHAHGDVWGGAVPGPRALGGLRPLLVGVVHGLAGSAAVALLVLGAIEDAALALVYLLLFGLGTIAGMVLITTALAVPVAAAAQRFASFHRVLGVATGLASVAFGGLLAYEIGFVQGLFSADVHWSPR
ncbi:MAG TPA: high-affinity nickel-transport family protein [Polyangiaceae bacterium]|jgi:high-affinity nickel-transport protein|nr:high-affinity nickel-transport family protein [Polyangiaceae bacterium]